jgi:WD40 repeat protein
VTADGEALLASVVKGETSIRLRQFTTGAVHRTMRGHAGKVYALNRVVVRGRPLLVSASHDRMVRLWDTNQRRGTPAPDADRAPAGHNGGVNAIARLTATTVATAGADGTVRIWDTTTGIHTLTGLRASTGIKALCILEHGPDRYLAAASYAGVVHVQEPADERPAQQFATHTGTINALTPVRGGRRPLLAGAAQDGALWTWDPLGGRRTAARRRRRLLNGGPIHALTTISASAGDLLVAATELTLQLIDPEDLTVRETLIGHEREIRTVTGFTLAGSQYLASGGADRTVRIWDPWTGHEVAALAGHTGTVNVVTALELGGRMYLLSGGSDRTLRLWDPTTQATVLSIPVYHPVLDCTAVGATLAVALSAGVLAIDLRPGGYRTG